MLVEWLYLRERERAEEEVLREHEFVYRRERECIEIV